MSYLTSGLDGSSPEQYPFFFYGTLRRGQENYTLLRWRTIHEQPARAPSMTLYSLKQFPIMAAGQSYVYGDLMILHPRLYHDLLVELDYLEGYDENNPISSLLQRVLIPVELASGRQVLAWAYLCGWRTLNAYPNKQVIDHGDWVYHKERQHIEARFGRYDPDIHGQPAAETWQQSDETEQELAMPQTSIFQWRAGDGWLVLAGHGALTDDETNSIVAEALARTVALGPLAYIYAAGDADAADKDLATLADMGSRTGYLVDIITEDNETLQEQLAEAGVIVLGDGPQVEKLRAALEGPANQAIIHAYQNGATVLGLGAGAAVLGQWLVTPAGEVKPSFGWLKGALVVVDGNDSPTMDVMHTFLSQYPNVYGLGINPGAAAAFSPAGALEMWGNQQITVALGSQLTRGD